MLDIVFDEIRSMDAEKGLFVHINNTDGCLHYTFINYLDYLVTKRFLFVSSQ